MAEINVKPGKLNLKNWTIVCGFQGTGLVGTITAQYMAKKLEAKQIGFIDSNQLPPVAILSEGEIKHPIRIFSVKKHKLLIVESELPIPQKLVFEIATELNNWAKKNGAKEIISVEGVTVEKIDKTPKIYAVVSNSSMEKKTSKHTELLKNGLIMGVAAAVLLESKDHNVKNTCYLAESHSTFPDGKAAAAIIEKLNSIFNIDIDTKPLIEESDKFEKKLKELIRKARYSPEYLSDKDSSKRMFG